MATTSKKTAPAVAKSKTVKLDPPKNLGEDAAVGTTLPDGRPYTVKVADAPIEVDVDSPEHRVLVDLGWTKT